MVQISFSRMLLGLLFALLSHFMMAQSHGLGHQEFADMEMKKDQPIGSENNFKLTQKDLVTSYETGSRKLKMAFHEAKNVEVLPMERKEALHGGDNYKPGAKHFVNGEVNVKLKNGGKANSPTDQKLRDDYISDHFVAFKDDYQHCPKQHPPRHN